MKKLFTILVAVCACAPLMTGCAVDTDSTPPTTTFIPQDPPVEDQDQQDDLSSGQCDEGEVKDCKVWVDERNCFVGEQTCTDGVWGDCE